MRIGRIIIIIIIINMCVVNLWALYSKHYQSTKPDSPFYFFFFFSGNNKILVS